MGKILCATRGGKASIQTQDAAIALAKERRDELAFLYVADTSFLNKTAAPLVVDVETELVRMGEFQLAMAQERAAAQDMTAQVIVRRGRLRTELIAATRELEATCIVLGRPIGKTAVFDQSAFEALATELQAETGSEVWIVEGG